MKYSSNMIGFYTIIRREVKRVIRIWPQTLLPPAITTTLYFLIFGHVIGSRIGQMAGHDYITFIAPGLIMMSMITSSYSGSVSSFFGAKFQRSIEEVLVSPIPNFLILLGYMSSGILRGILVGVIVTIIALLFVHLEVYSMAVILFISLSSVSIFSLAGVINAIYARKFDDIMIIPTFVLTPLIYLGGVFYAIKLLPGFWQFVSFINPIVYIINSFRFGFLGITDSYLTFSIIAILCFTILLFIIALRLINKGVGLRE